MINNPELIEQVINNIKKLSKKDLDKVMKEADKWYNREVTDINVGNIEEAIKQLKGIDIKFLLSGSIEQSNYIIDEANKTSQAIEIVLGNLEALCDMQKSADRELKNLNKINNKLKEKIKELEAKLKFKQFGDLDNIEFEDYMNEFVPKQKIKDKIEELKYRADRIAGTYQYADSQEHLQEKKNKVIELRTKAITLEELLKEVNK